MKRFSHNSHGIFVEEGVFSRCEVLLNGISKIYLADFTSKYGRQALPFRLKLGYELIFYAIHRVDFAR